MAFSDEERKRIVDVIEQRVPKPYPCVVCGHTEWAIADAPVTFPLQDTPGAIALGGRTFPCVPIICRHCGNMQFLNMLVLGLRDITEAKTTPAPEESAEPEKR